MCAQDSCVVQMILWLKPKELLPFFYVTVMVHHSDCKSIFTTGLMQSCCYSMQPGLDDQSSNSISKLVISQARLQSQRECFSKGLN